MDPFVVVRNTKDYTDEQIIECFQKHANEYYVQSQEDCDKNAFITLTHEHVVGDSASLLAYILTSNVGHEAILRLLRLIYKHVHVLAHSKICGMSPIEYVLRSQTTAIEIITLLFEQECTCTDIFNTCNQGVFHIVVNQSKIFNMLIEKNVIRTVTMVLRYTSIGDALALFASHNALDAFMQLYYMYVQPSRIGVERSIGNFLDSHLAGTCDCETSLHSFVRHSNMQGIEFIRSILSEEQFRYYVTSDAFRHKCTKCGITLSVVETVIHTENYPLIEYFLNVLESSIRYTLSDDFFTAISAVITRNNLAHFRFVFDRFTVSKRLLHRTIKYLVRSSELFEFFRYLHLKFGDSIFVDPEKNDTIVHTAALYLNHRLLAYVLDRIPEHVNSENHHHQTPIECIQSYGHAENTVETYHTLLLYGAKLHKTPGMISTEILKTAFRTNNDACCNFILRISRGYTLADAKLSATTYQTWSPNMCGMFTHYGRSFFDFVNETQGTMWATYSDNRRQYLQAYQLTDRRVPFPTYAHLLARELPLVDDTPEDDIHELRFRRYFAVSMTVLLLEAQDDYLERQQYPALRDPPQRRLLY